jgi:dTMP kinase
MLITFEGGEGAGKTSLINSLDKELSLQGINLVKTREPGGSFLSEHIRSWLLNLDFEVKVGKKAELLLFLAARAQHLEELIVPALTAEKIVFCDRFNDSTIVYQGLARGLGVKKTEELCKLVCDGIEPLLTFFLDVDPEVGLARTKRTRKENANDGEMDRIESEGLEFHRLVQQGFRELAKANPQRIYTLDANQSEAEVLARALAILRQKLVL